MKLPLKLSNDGIHYDCTKRYSYGLFLAMILGGRGVGKTTTFNIDGLHQCEKGYQFIYMRRYKSEIKEFVNKDSLSPIIDGIVYKGDGNGGYTIIYEDIVLGYAIPLSTARSYKSVDFSKVTRIIYDEAIVKQSTTYRYLNDEVITLLEFISTVQRTRTNLFVNILGNNEDIFNPYYSFFNIPLFGDIYTDRERGIYCENVVNSVKLLELEKKTGLYALTIGTAYGNYHYSNEVLTARDYRIDTKPPSAKLLFRLVFNKQTVNVYYCNDNITQKNILYFERKDKIIKDNITYNILENGVKNFLHMDMFKKKLKGFVFKHYFNNLVMYNDNKCGPIIEWLIEQS